MYIRGYSFFWIENMMCCGFLLTLNKVGNEMSLRLMLNYSGVDMLNYLGPVNTFQRSSTNLKRNLFQSFQLNFKKLASTPFT